MTEATWEDIEFELNIVDNNVAETIGQITEQLQRAEAAGQETFDDIEKGAEKSAFKAQLLSAIIHRLTYLMVDMAKKSVIAFTEFISGSVEAAAQGETLQKSFLGLFDGSKEAAAQTYNEIRRQGIALGIDLQELAFTFLPKVESLDQFKEIAKIATVLAGLNKQQGTYGAGVALSEALSGNLMSLQRRFNFSAGDLSAITKMQSELGATQGLIEGLGKLLADRGQDFDTLTDTAQVWFNRLAQFLDDLKLRFGEPILEILKEDLKAIVTYVQDHQEDFQVLAATIGDILTQLAGLQSDNAENFLEGFDVTKITAFALELQNIVAYAQALLSIQNNPTIDNGAVDQVRSLADEYLKLGDAIEAIIKLAGIAGAVLNGSLAISNQFAASLGQLTFGDIDLETFKSQVGNLGEIGKLAASESLKSTQDVLDQLEATIERNKQAFIDRQEAINEAANADTNIADSILAERAALEALTKAEVAATEAKVKLTEQQNELAIGEAQDRLKEQLRVERDLLNLEIKIAEDRQDAAIENQRNIDKLNRSYKDKIADAVRNAADKEKDVLEDIADERVKLSKDKSNKLLEIERDYYRTLRQIQLDFEAQAEDAIARNDAIAYVRALRQKDRAILDAKNKRDDSIADTLIDDSNKLDEFEKNAKKKLEDVRKDSQRTLEQLNLDLNRRLNEQQISYQQELEDIQLNEQRKREALALAAQQRLVDLDIEWANKKAALLRNLQEELAIIQRYEQLKLQARTSRGSIRRGSSRTVNGEDEFFSPEIPRTINHIIDNKEKGNKIPEIFSPEKSKVINNLSASSYTTSATVSNTSNIVYNNQKVNLNPQLINSLSPRLISKLNGVSVEALEELFGE